MRNVTQPPSPDDAFAGATAPGGFAPSPTYFEKPLLKRPHWGWNVVTYLFFGGIMGGSAIIAALAKNDASPSARRLVTNAKLTSLALAAVCPLVLISHLGRPERFLNMLRILKFKSPMSVGVWGLVAFSAVATGGVVEEAVERKLLPRMFGLLVPPGAHALQAVLGGFIGGYTGVLISATAIPIWAKGKRHIPAFSVASGIAGACALQSLLLCNDDENEDALRKLEKFETAAAAVELLLLLDFKRHSGPYGKPMYEGALGERFKALTMGLGLAFPLAVNAFRTIAIPRAKTARMLTIATSLATLFGGYILRDTLIESGKLSADDPHAAFAQPQ